MLIAFTVLVMLAAAYAQYRNGLFSSIAMLIEVVLAGLVAFNFWEPLATLLEPSFGTTGLEDFVALSVLFCLSLGLMRFVTVLLVPDQIEQHGAVQKIGAAVVGLGVGYLVAGFLVCLFQTLPLEENFLGFEMRTRDEGLTRSLLPPDRVWLSLMRDAGAYPLNNREENADAATTYDRYQTFDRDATFELRYARYRRHTEARGPMQYQGEFDREIYQQHKEKPR